MKSTIFFIKKDAPIFRVLEERNFDLSPNSIIQVTKEEFDSIDKDIKILTIDSGSEMGGGVDDH